MYFLKRVRYKIQAGEMVEFVKSYVGHIKHQHIKKVEETSP